MSRIFSHVKGTRLRRNPFNLSHDVKLTTDFGRLTPVLCKEVVPGDTIRLRSEMLIRTAPLYAPLMHRVNAFIHFYFVPTRILQDNWETFITGGKDGDGKVTERFGTLAERQFKTTVTLKELCQWYQWDKQSLKTLFGESSLFDYLGFPALSDDDIDDIFNSHHPAEKVIDLLPFKAFQMIWNEYYRDETFQDEVDIFSDVNGDLITYLNQAISGGADGRIVGQKLDAFLRLHQRNWQKDYFTSALPWPQRGDDTTIGDGSPVINITGQGSFSAPITGSVANIAGQSIAGVISAHMANGSIVSINELRRALAVQRFKERSARFGSRLTEFLRGFFGVSPGDARLQRPEFLGGFSQPLQFGEVLQTSETTSTSPQGGYAGTGFSLSGGKYIKANFKEHGFVFGILSVMPKPAYMQGWPREFDRFDKFDYFLPDFEHIGEQPIKESELVFDVLGSAEDNDAVFGYTPRYSEYKYAANRVCGQMRSSLDFWHLARRVQLGQNLNGSFISLNQTEMYRVFNVVGDSSSVYDHLWVQVAHDLKILRPMSKFGTPMIY